ncbi:hypothetical protein GGI12_003885 [Dipsacomyces acuminosporus]|nr:hypothetical protein GGI12_003885 [Dipsacomyces acuminosporus]
MIARGGCMAAGSLMLFARRQISTANPEAPKPLTAAFCVIGDEILNGKTIDTNSHYFAKRCFELGVQVEKIEVIPDSYEAIEASAQQLSQLYDIVFTSGGIGPTHDDITYSAIARAFKSGLAYHEETLSRMRRIIKQRLIGTVLPDPHGTPEQVACARMALFPRDSTTSYPRDDYWVPVVCVANKIHIFPGIPKLFQDLVDGYLPALVASLSKGPPQAFVRSLVGTRLRESVVAPALERLQEHYAKDQIRLGSYPNWNPDQHKNETSLSTTRHEPVLVLSVVGKNEDQVNACKAELCKLFDGFDLEASDHKLVNVSI